MSIELKGNDESSFSDGATFAVSDGAGVSITEDGRVPVTGNDAVGFRINKDSIFGYSGAGAPTTSINSDGSAEFDGSITIGPSWGSDQSTLIDDAEILLRQDNASQVFGVYYGGSAESDNTVSITGAGAASFKGAIEVDRAEGTNTGLIIRESGTANARLFANGNASFNGTLTSADSFINLDTGGTLDVKERLQNTQAILYRLKAALIQPDADANQLRTRLLEALDILTSDGDES